MSVQIRYVVPQPFVTLRNCLQLCVGAVSVWCACVRIAPVVKEEQHSIPCTATGKRSEGEAGASSRGYAPTTYTSQPYKAQQQGDVRSSHSCTRIHNMQARARRHIKYVHAHTLTHVRMCYQSNHLTVLDLADFLLKCVHMLTVKCRHT
jgi:hypothetical protein